MHLPYAKRVLSLILAIALIAPGFITTPAAFAQPASLPSAASALQPEAVGPVALAASAPNIVGPNSIRVNLYNGEDPTDTTTGFFESGEIDKRAPKWDGHSFVRAWLRDPTNEQNQLEIDQILFKTGKPGLGIPNDEAYVIVRPKFGHNDKFNLCIPMSQTSRFLYFEYVKIGDVVNLSYSYQSNQGVKVAGPTKIYRQANGLAQGYFNVSVPRNANPSVDFTPKNGVTIQKVEDISEPKRTIFRYQITVPKNFNQDTVSISAYSTPKGELGIDFKKQYSEDWNLGDPKGKYKNTMYGSPSKSRYRFGDTISFNVYHDRGVRARTPYQVLLGSLYLNDIGIGAPQPFARYGKDAYDMPNYKFVTPQGKTIFLNGNTLPSLKPSGYSINGDINDQKNVSRDLRPCPYYTQSYSWSQGWNLDGSGQIALTDKGEYGYATWWRSQICDKVIGATTEKFIDNGPLAGAKVTIKIIDAIPYSMGRDLGDYPAGKPWENAWYSNNYLERITNVNEGYQNSMRLAYTVTIENVPTSLEVGSEWVRTDTAKVGVYENEGVQNVQAYVSNIGNTGGVNKNYKWMDIPNKQGVSWLDINAIPNTDFNNSSQIIENGNPSVRLRGNVINGYHNVHAVSNSYHMPGLKPLNKPELPGSDDFGFEVEIPTVAKGGDVIAGGGAGGRVMYGGMSTIGVKADLMDIPVYYDYQGGSAQNPGAIPTQESGKAENYEVNANPIVNIPNELPTKQVDGKNLTALYWHLYYYDANLNRLVDTGKDYYPGSSFDIREREDVGTRLSSIDGRAITKNFVLKAVYEDTPLETPLSYTAVVHLKGKVPGTNSTRIETRPVTNFLGVKGVYAQVKAPAEAEAPENPYPPTLTYKNKTYYRDANYNPERMVLLGSDRKSAYVVVYKDETEAQRWANSYGSQGKAVGRVVTYDWGTEMTVPQIKRMIQNASLLPDNVKITANPNVDTYRITIMGQEAPQMPNITITFSDNSTLTVNGAGAFVNPPNITGVADLNNPWGIAALLLAVSAAAGLGYYWYRRRTQAQASQNHNGKHGRMR